jgi:DNA-directed RNA polymerase subunit RPC12/RpoP
MKAGQEISCPHCAKTSFLKKVVLMDGWTNKGEILSCASCSAKIADINEKDEKTDKNDKVSKLAGFLGETGENKKPTLKPGDDENRFCRDCLHFIKHPFSDKCGLGDKTVNPMDDCEHFKKKT